MNILFPRDVLVEVGCLFVPSAGGVFAPIVVLIGCFLLFTSTLAKVMFNAGFLNIISRQIALFPYLTASAFFDDLVTAGFHSPCWNCLNLKSFEIASLYSSK